MKYNKLKLIILILPMILVFSGCNKQVEDLSDEKGGKDEGVEMGKIINELGNKDNFIFEFLGQDEDGWNKYGIYESKLSFRVPGEWSFSGGGDCLNGRSCDYLSFKNEKIHVWDSDFSYIFLLACDNETDTFVDIDDKEDYWEWLEDNKCVVLGGGIDDVTLFNINKQNDFIIAFTSQIMSVGGANEYRFFYYYKPEKLLLVFETNEFIPGREDKQKEEVYKYLEAIIATIK